MGLILKACAAAKERSLKITLKPSVFSVIPPPAPLPVTRGVGPIGDERGRAGVAKSSKVEGKPRLPV